MYQALYRRYRSKNFDEVMGQEHITVTLKNEIASGRIGHAYLFTGSRGIGKTSCSRIIAKAVNCPNQKDGNPCGECDICQGIDDGTILDVTEIDAASNNGVDNIRQLREEANFTPAVVKYRVYIIDEAHMLSVGAFNALLKILEEPPEHVIFILATTEVHKIPATILSRCQRFDFRRIKSDVIVEHLLAVCEEEGIPIERDAAKLIARLSEGGMRDALSLLDVCRSTAQRDEGEEPELSGAITCSVVSEAAGLAVQDCLFQIADAVLSQDIPQIISLIDQMYENSIDYEKMCSQLISHYRGLMMARAVKEPERFILSSDDEIAQLKKQAEGYSMPQILYCLTVLQDTISRINKTTQTRTELEMAVIKLTNPAMEGTAEAINARLTRLEEALKTGNFTVRAQKPQEQEAKPAAVPPAHLETAPSAVGQEAKPAEPLLEVTRFQPWPDVLERLKHCNNALYGALVNASAYQRDGLILIDCDNPFFLELIRSNEYAKKSIHDALIQAAGQDFRIGPYKKEKYRREKTDDPLETILASAMEQGVSIDIQDE